MRIPGFDFDLSRDFFLIGGPCVIESRAHAVRMATEIRDIAAHLSVPYIFKASFDKANRTSVKSFRGPGIEAGLEVLASVREEVGVPVLSDVHEPSQAEAGAAVLDVIQIPAFLCRQTDLRSPPLKPGRSSTSRKASSCRRATSGMQSRRSGNPETTVSS